jgi:hypothetical protein
VGNPRVERGTDAYETSEIPFLQSPMWRHYILAWACNIATKPQPPITCLSLVPSPGVEPGTIVSKTIVISDFTMSAGQERWLRSIATKFQASHATITTHPGDPTETRTLIGWLKAILPIQLEDRVLLTVRSNSVTVGTN